MSESIWYYARGESEQGPISTAQIKALAATGALRRDDLVSLGKHRLKGVKDDPELFTLSAIEGLGPTLGHPVAVKSASG